MKIEDSNKLCVQPLGRDEQGNIYWYFYGLRLYREECSIPPESLKMLWEEEWRRECEKYFNNKERKMKYKSKIKYYRKKLKSFEKNKLKNLKDQKHSQPKWTVICNTLEDWYKLAERLRKSKSLWEKKLYNVLADGFLAAIEKLAEEKGDISDYKYTERRSSARIEEKQRDKEIFDNFALRNEQTIQRNQRSDIVGKLHSKSEKRKISEEKRNNEDDDLSSNLNMVLNLDSESASLSVTDGNFFENLSKVIQCIKNHKDAWPFLETIDENYAPGYYNIIKYPVDLAKMEMKVLQKTYTSWQDVEKDFQQIIHNCKMYNGPNSDYTYMASSLMKSFKELTKKYSTENGQPKKRVRFQINSSEKNDNLENADNNFNINKSDNKITRGRKKKKRPVRMKAIEILAKAAEKALEEISSNKFEESSSEENSSKFPDLKISTTQSHPSLYLAKCASDNSVNKDLNKSLEDSDNNSNVNDFRSETNQAKENVRNEKQNHDLYIMESECTLNQNERTVCNDNLEGNLNILEAESADKHTEVIINYKQNIEDNTAEFGTNNFQFTNNGLKSIAFDENTKAPQVMVYNLNDKETNSSLTVENFEPLLQDSESLPVTELQNNEILETLSDNENYISPNCSPSAPLYFITSPENKVNGDISKSLNMPDSQNNVSEEHLTRNEFLSLVQNDILHLLDPNEVNNSVPLTNKVQPPVTTQFYLYPADPQFSLCNNRMINCMNNSQNFRSNSQVPIESPQQLVFTQLPPATFHGSQIITTHSLISRNENLPLMTSQGQFVSSQPNAQITSMFPFPIPSYNQNNDQILKHKSPQFYADTFINNRTTVNKNTNYSVQNLCPQNKPALSNKYFIHDNKSGSPQQGSIFNEVHYMNPDHRPYINIATPLQKQHGPPEIVNILSDSHKEYNVYPIESMKHITLSSTTDPKFQENRKDSVQTTNNAVSNSNICLINSEQFQQISPSLNEFSFQKSAEVINSVSTSFQPSSSLEPKMYPDKANIVIPLSIPNTNTEVHYNLANVLGNHSQYIYYVPDRLQSVQKNHSHPDSIYSSSETSPPIKEHTMAFPTPSLLNQSSRMDPNAVPLVSSSNNKQINNQ